VLWLKVDSSCASRFAIKPDLITVVKYELCLFPGHIVSQMELQSEEILITIFVICLSSSPAHPLSLVLENRLTFKVHFQGSCMLAKYATRSGGRKLTTGKH